MGRKAIATEEQVFKAADTLAAGGKEVTASALLVALGGGSLSTIYQHFNSWRTSRPALVAPVSPIDLPEPVQTAFAAAWKVAASEAAREVSSIRDKAAEDVKAANKEFQEALEQIVRLEAEAEVAEQEIETLKGKLAESEERLHAVQAESIRHETEAQQFRGLVEKLEREVERLRKESSAAEDRHHEERQKLSSQIEQMVYSAKNGHEKINKLEDMCRSMKSEQADLARQQKHAEEASKVSREERDKAVQEAAELRGRVASLQEQNDKFILELGKGNK
jgi:chromosome segregation ATPase